MKLNQTLILTKDRKFPVGTIDDDELSTADREFQFQTVEIGKHSSTRANAVVKLFQDELIKNPAFHYIKLTAWIDPEEEITHFKLDINTGFSENLTKLISDATITFECELEGKFHEHRRSMKIHHQFPVYNLPASDNGYHSARFTSYNYSDINRVTCTLRIGIEWTEQYEGMQLCASTFLQSLLADENEKDLIIVAENEAEIKCHRLIFSAHSKVFKSMISAKSGMKESQSGRIVMEQFSEEAIQYLVQYLYGQQIRLNFVSSEVVVELFQIAHLYELVELEQALLQMLQKTDVYYFTPGNLLVLYMITRNVDTMTILTDHLLTLMRSIEGLQTCEEYMQLSDADSAEISKKINQLGQSNQPA